MSCQRRKQSVLADVCLEHYLKRFYIYCRRYGLYQLCKFQCSHCGMLLHGFLVTKTHSRFVEAQTPYECHDSIYAMGSVAFILGFLIKFAYVHSAIGVTLYSVLVAYSCTGWHVYCVLTLSLSAVLKSQNSTK